VEIVRSFKQLPLQIRAVAKIARFGWNSTIGENPEEHCNTLNHILEKFVQDGSLLSFRIGIL
jgi:hypothetical protein